MTLNTLSAKVKARNRANALALTIGPIILTELIPFVGQKVIKSAGGFTKKFSEVLPTLNEINGVSNPQEHCFIDSGLGYTIKITIRVSEMENEHSCVYAESVVYLADLRDGVITRLYDAIKPEDYRTDYSVAEIQSLEHSISAAESTLSTLRSKMQIFS